MNKLRLIGVLALGVASAGFMTHQFAPNATAQDANQIITKDDLSLGQTLLIEVALDQFEYKVGKQDGVWDDDFSKAMSAYMVDEGREPDADLTADVACYLLFSGTALYGSSANLPHWCGF